MTCVKCNSDMQLIAESKRLRCKCGIEIPFDPNESLLQPWFDRITEFCGDKWTLRRASGKWIATYNDVVVKGPTPERAIETLVGVL